MILQSVPRGEGNSNRRNPLTRTLSPRGERAAQRGPSPGQRLAFVALANGEKSESAASEVT